MNIVASGWKRLSAIFRWDLNAVCELSNVPGDDRDYHDWPDSKANAPWHFYKHSCVRCGKHFDI